MHALFNTGPLELVFATGESTFRVWVLCPRFGRDLRHFGTNTKVHGFGPATVLAQEMGRSQEQHEEVHGTVWIVVHGRLLRCAPEHLRHLSERESLSIDRDEGDIDKARTFTDIVQDFRFSKGTHVDLRSQHDPPDGSEPRYFSGKIFVRSPTEMPGASSSGMRTETRPVVELTVVLSDTTLENPMSTTHDSSEPTPAPEID